MGQVSKLGRSGKRIDAGAAAAVTLLALLFLQVSTARACYAPDRATLLAFKKVTERDNTGLLDSWTPGGDCCRFYGVTCNPAGRVSKLEIVVPPLLPDCDGDYDICPNLQRAENFSNPFGRIISKLADLEVLYFSNYDVIDDVTPTGLSALKKLRVLRIEFAQFKGTVSNDIYQIKTLQHLSLAGSHKLSGTISTAVCALRDLQTLDFTGGYLGSTLLRGPIPPCIGRLTGLQNLLLDFNRLTGPVPKGVLALQNLRALRLSGNQLTGRLPPVTAPGLTNLTLDGNKFVGPIPASYSTLLNLEELRIGGINTVPYDPKISNTTNISGTLPEGLSNLVKLEVLIIRATKITGRIPPSYAKLINLVDLELDYNQLVIGPLPDFTKFPKLETLALLGNKGIE